MAGGGEEVLGQLAQRERHLCACSAQVRRGQRVGGVHWDEVRAVRRCGGGNECGACTGTRGEALGLPV